MTNINFKKRILFIGVPDMAYMGLDTLFYSGVNIAGVIGPPKTHGTYQVFKNFVIAHKLNFIEYDKLDSVSLIERIRNLNIDLGVVCSFDNKIPKIFIDTIKDGIINIHPSLLPLYRGGNPYSRVIMNGETETGVTLHFISENFDEGDIIHQEKCSIELNETMGTLFDKTNKIGCKMLLNTLIEYENNYLPRIKQPQGEFIKAKNLSNEELFIDYNESSTEIERFVRALNPYLTPITVFRNQMVKVFKMESICDEPPKNIKNGTIYKIVNDDIFIKTSSGAVIPKILQYGGLFIGDTKDFIDMVKPQIGEIFKNG